MASFSEKELEALIRRAASPEEETALAATRILFRQVIEPNCDSFDPADPGVPANAPKRVIRGGSFLCNVDYCLSYRPSARRGCDPSSPMSHLGFRLVRDA